MSGHLSGFCFRYPATLLFHRQIDVSDVRMKHGTIADQRIDIFHDEVRPSLPERCSIQHLSNLRGLSDACDGLPSPFIFYDFAFRHRVKAECLTRESEDAFSSRGLNDNQKMVFWFLRHIVIIKGYLPVRRRGSIEPPRRMMKSILIY